MNWLEIRLTDYVSDMLRLIQYASGTPLDPDNPPNPPGQKYDVKSDCNDTFKALLDLASGSVSDLLVL